MKAGDTVTIYEDPITQQKPEGISTLVTHLDGPDADGIEQWEVQFSDEEPGDLHNRFIYPNTN